VLRPAPHRSYAGHEADVLDVAWSRSQFLLSASMDKTVRLWHISMDDSLRVFRRGPTLTLTVLLPGFMGSCGTAASHDCLLMFRQAPREALLRNY